VHALTRRRERDVHQECWRIYYGDTCVDTIGERASVPVDVNQWGGVADSILPFHHRLHADNTAETFEHARAEFGAAWREYLPLFTEADFAENRRDRAFTA
jgi:hypothetical protein